MDRIVSPTNACVFAAFAAFAVVAAFVAVYPHPDTAAIPDDIHSIIANTRAAAFLPRCIFLSTR
jgi:flagellar biosynthesis protein FliR